FEIPFVGMVPGVKPAALRSPGGRVVILATPGTLDGELYARVVADFGGRARISSVSGDGLAEIVEEGKHGTERSRLAVRGALDGEVIAGADTVVLGCTHYHFLADDIRAEFPQIDIVDTSEAVARRAVQVLHELDRQAPADQAGDLNLIVTGDQAKFRSNMAKLGFAPTLMEATT
ncbi:MAG: aspartate/glutamate racemase family protein, partial [Tepidiformaceae bacterium]